MKTYADCVKKGEELCISTNEIAQAFGIEIPMDEASSKLIQRLKDPNTTQEERWKVYENAPCGSAIEQAALQIYLDNATTQDERWRVIDKTPNGGPVRQATIRALCSNS